MFTYKGYTAKIEVNTEAGLLHGKVLNISDIVPFEGRTVEEAEQEFRRSVDEYLEFCEQCGIEPERPFSGKLPFRTTPETHRAIYQAATKVDKSINSWMEDVLSEAAQRSLTRKSAAVAKPAADAPPDAVRRLLEEPTAIAQLIVKVEPFLESKEPYVIVQLVSALEKLLTGIDAIKPFLKIDEAEIVVKVVSAIEPLLGSSALDVSARPVNVVQRESLRSEAKRSAFEPISKHPRKR